MPALMAGEGLEWAVDCVDLDALEQQARRVMPPASWVFCDTGADDEITAKENIVAWRKLRLRPRMLRDIVNIDTGVTPARRAGKDADHGGADRPAQSVSRRGRAGDRARLGRGRRALCDVDQRHEHGGERRQGRRRRAAMVPALHAARPRRDGCAARPLRRRRLQGAGADRRSAGAGLEPARLSHAG